MIYDCVASNDEDEDKEEKSKDINCLKHSESIAHLTLHVQGY